MSQHSPGPWVCEPERRLRSQVLSESIGVRGPGGLYIAAAFDFNRTDRDAEVEANARLIAAAPDLLAALDALAQFIDANTFFLDSTEQVLALERVMDGARAAVGQAKGGAS